MTGAGALRERLTIQENNPDPVAVTSLTRVTTTATAGTGTAHGYSAGDYVTVAGATPAGYNGKVKLLAVPTATSFTYTVNGTLATPATGTITVVYVSDAQGGRKLGWADYRKVAAELVPVRAWEHAQLAAVQVQLDYRFSVQTVDCAGVTPAMRALWVPQWPPGEPQKTLEIHGILPDGDGRYRTFLECGAAA